LSVRVGQVTAAHYWWRYCNDVASLSEPDQQALCKQSREYSKFTEATMIVGKSPDIVERHKWETTPGMAAWVLSLGGEWKSCSVHTADGRFLSIRAEDRRIVESGLSGSPIINAGGAAIGLISTSGSAAGGFHPSVMNCLPPWFLGKLDVGVDVPIAA
jgi:hypothetical protein